MNDGGGVNWIVELCGIVVNSKSCPQTHVIHKTREGAATPLLV